MKVKTVGNRSKPKTPAEFYALGAKLDLQARVIGPPRKRGFVLKARTWEDLERWEKARSVERAARMRAE